MEDSEGSLLPSTSPKSVMVVVVEVVQCEVVVDAGAEDFVENFAVNFEEGNGSIVFDMVLG